MRSSSRNGDVLDAGTGDVVDLELPEQLVHALLREGVNLGASGVPATKSRYKRVTGSNSSAVSGLWRISVAGLVELMRSTTSFRVTTWSVRTRFIVCCSFEMGMGSPTRDCRQRGAKVAHPSVGVVRATLAVGIETSFPKVFSISVMNTGPFGLGT